MAFVHGNLFFSLLLFNLICQCKFNSFEFMLFMFINVLPVEKENDLKKHTHTRQNTKKGN